MLDGAFNITYIYDALDVGTTMLDLRVDLTPGISDAMLNQGSGSLKQGSGSLNQANESLQQAATKIKGYVDSIAQLKSQYTTLLNKGENAMTDSMLTQAKSDYDQELLKRVGSKLDNNSLPPAKGVVIRIFYDGLTGTNINVTGFITDPRAVTSFIKDFNGGLDVPIGNMPGNTNYAPKIVYDENQSETLNCRDPNTIKRMITDYTTNIGLDTSILMNADPPFDITDKALFVSEVTHAVQVSPTQCALRWKG